MKKNQRHKNGSGLAEFAPRQVSQSAQALSHEVSIRIISALNNRQYKVRTIGGIAQETGLSRTVVAEAIRNNSELTKVVKISPVRAKSGKVLITTKERFGKESSLKEKFIDFFSTARIGVHDSE